MSENKFPVLRIEGNDSVLAKKYKVFLDGQDISRFTRSIQLYIGVDKVTFANLEIVVKPDIPDILLEKAHVKIYNSGEQLDVTEEQKGQ